RGGGGRGRRRRGRAGRRRGARRRGGRRVLLGRDDRGAANAEGGGDPKPAQERERGERRGEAGCAAWAWFHGEFPPVSRVVSLPEMPPTAETCAALPANHPFRARYPSDGREELFLEQPVAHPPAVDDERATAGRGHLAPQPRRLGVQRAPSPLPLEA